MSHSWLLRLPIVILALVLAAATSLLMVLSVVPDYLITTLGLPLLVAIPFVAGLLYWMRVGAIRGTPQRTQVTEPVSRPSFAWVVWPIAVLPVSALLTNFVGRCPRNPPGISLGPAAAAYFAPPLLVGLMLLALRWRHPGPNTLRVFAVSALAVCFLAACVVDSLLFLLSVMGEC